MICYFHKTLGAINIHVSKTNFTINSPPPPMAIKNYKLLY